MDPRCELALQTHLKALISPSCQVLHPHPSPSSRGMINTCFNKPHQLLLFPPIFAAGSGSHALFSTSWFAELWQAEKLLPTHHITTLFSTPKVFLQIEAQSWRVFSNIQLRFGPDFVQLSLQFILFSTILCILSHLTPRMYELYEAKNKQGLMHFMSLFKVSLQVCWRQLFRCPRELFFTYPLNIKVNLLEIKSIT